VSVLAIDTASRSRSSVLRTTADGTILEHREVAGGALDRDLAAALAAVLTDDVAAVVVLTGPGSYSGVRAGMAAALGVAGARGVPLHGLGNLTAMAHAAAAAPGTRFSVAADAGRGGVYIAGFERGDALTTQVSPLRRVEAGDVHGGDGMFAPEAIAGLAAVIIDPVRALAAAVPVALASPPLAAAGLSATHAVAAAGGGPPAVLIAPATAP
jgi:tRNA threonylcarbamoyl adenosine modification protein YeaZ